jgi:G3E family GTPase
VTIGQLATTEGLVHRLNPNARLIRSRRSVVNMADVLDTGRYDSGHGRHVTGVDRRVGGLPHLGSRGVRHPLGHLPR